jgi:hypothetical protein
MKLELTDINNLETWADSNVSYKAVKILDIPELDVFGFIDHKEIVHILIRCDESIFEDENRKGISIKLKNIDTHDKGSINVLDFSCKRNDFKNNFILIINEIIEETIKSNKLIESVKSIINKWFYFLQKPKQEQLSENEIIGLIGELLSIKDFNEYSTMDSVIESWVGPLKIKRDFIFNSTEIEIKTSSTKKGHVHTVHGFDQLSALKDGQVYVYSWNISKDLTMESFSLNTVVKEIVDICGDNTILIEKFYKKLNLLKFDSRDSESYEEFKFRLIGKKLLIVDKSFPKIDRNSFNFKLTSMYLDLNYTIDLNSLESIEFKKITI